VSPAAGAPQTALTVDLNRVRGFWMQRQGLLGDAGPDAASTIRRCGWPRTLGGVDAYLSLWTRCPSVERATVDSALADDAGLWIVPAARGCIYIVPTDQVAMAVQLGATAWWKRTRRDLAKVGVPEDEVRGLGEAVLAALGDGTLSVDQVRKALPDGAIRSLGAPGKKVGMSSTLPTALRLLEADGRIRRQPETARLDSQRYAWRRPAGGAFGGAVAPADEAALNENMASLFFRQAGPATLNEFCAWTGIGKRAGKAAIAALGLVEVAVEGHGACWLFEEDLDALRAATPADELPPVLLPFEDGYVSYRGALSCLARPGDLDRPVKIGGSGTERRLGDATAMWQRVVIDGGCISGYWEWDPDDERVVTGTFADLPAARARKLTERADAMGAFITEQLGTARAFSLDSDKQQRKRLAWLAAMTAR